MSLLVRLLAWLLPASGGRRRTAVTHRPETPQRWARRSPYAEDAADDRTLYVDPPLWNTLRPYVHVHARPRPAPAEQRTQAHRRGPWRWRYGGGMWGPSGFMGCGLGWKRREGA